MKKSIIPLCLLGAISFVASCGSKNDSTSSIEKERDSLLTVNSQQQMILDNITSTMAEISMSLDSIAIQEQMIIRGVDELGNPLNKKNLKSKLTSLSKIIKNQREKMASMEATMKADKTAMGQLKNIIAYLNASLEQKDLEIQKLRSEIDSKNFNISQLRTHVTNLKDTVATVQNENAEQKVQIAKQDASLNEVYYIIGTKDQLINAGVISKTGTIIKKTKINFSSLDKSVLTKADRRNLKNITINGKSPKILSEAPKGSYSLDKRGNSSVLIINDSEKFWSANNKILVIQIK